MADPIPRFVQRSVDREKIFRFFKTARDTTTVDAFWAVVCTTLIDEVEVSNWSGRNTLVSTLCHFMGMVTDPDHITSWDAVMEQTNWFIAMKDLSWGEAIRRSLVVLVWRLEDESALAVPAMIMKECTELITVISTFRAVPVISANEVMVHLHFMLSALRVSRRGRRPGFFGSEILRDLVRKFPTITSEVVMALQDATSAYLYSLKDVEVIRKYTKRGKRPTRMMNHPAVWYDIYAMERNYRNVGPGTMDAVARHFAEMDDETVVPDNSSGELGGQSGAAGENEAGGWGEEAGFSRDEVARNNTRRLRPRPRCECPWGVNPFFEQAGGPVETEEAPLLSSEAAEIVDA